MVVEVIYYMVCAWAFYRLNVSLDRDIHQQYDVMKELYK